MRSNDKRKINSILRKVLDLEPAERTDYLDQLDIDQRLRNEIEAMLALEITADNWSPSTGLELSKNLFDDELSENELIGSTIGVYEIKKEIGFGGMGAVYLGERIDGKFSQKVAIKMLRRELNIKKIRDHFRREREIQARLLHPHIAALLDAGTTDDGIPYLIIEYVEGVKIDKYCAENQLDLNERLKLFNKVCEAVSYAHQNLVIHRDIKPSNIIITREGEPKLLDFGISKLIDDQGESARVITQFGAMTPDFASPEQIAGKTVSTATDIYSLGVVLYKILTGALPYKTEENPDKNAFDRVVRSEPVLPSQASQKNQKLLKGDLDNIILKALRKEPERRYSTVEQFSADIWRFIDGLPVLARPATLSYRAKKFYLRNKIQVIAGVLILLSLIAGISVGLWQAVKAREQARIAAEEADRAKKITRFMEKIIGYANPGPYAEGYSSGGDARVIDVLNQMSDTIESEFPHHADIQAELHHKFAEVYTMRETSFDEPSSLEKAREHAIRALELRKKYYGENHELVAKDMYYLWASKSKAGSEDQEELAKLLANAIRLMREQDPTNINLPYMLQDYSNRLWNDERQELFDIYYRNAIPSPQTDRLTLAENYLTESLPIFRKHYAEDHSTVKYGKCLIGMIQIEKKKFDEAKGNFGFCFEVSNSQVFIERRRKYAAILEEGLRSN